MLKITSSPGLRARREYAQDSELPGRLRFLDYILDLVAHIFLCTVIAVRSIGAVIITGAIFGRALRERRIAQLRVFVEFSGFHTELLPKDLSDGTAS